MSAPTADLTGRTARCSCGHERPSSPELPFFQYRGPGSRDQLTSCKHCRYAPEAHTRKAETGERHLDRVCDNFEADPDGRQDTFYCGCRGWD